MGILDFNFARVRQFSNPELPELFTLSIAKDRFIRSDILSTYIMILTDVLERTHGIPKDKQKSLWDNCLQSENNLGLVSLLAEAMTNMSDLYIVYLPSINLLREATFEEQQKICEDYAKTSSSSVGTYISFRNYRRTEMLRIYSELEYCVLASLNKTVNISKAIQFKVDGMRSSVANFDVQPAAEQARAVATALGNGKDTMIDAGDEIVLATPDISPTEKSIMFLNGKRAFILSLPRAYIVGDQTVGLNANGEADAQAIERGLKQYFVSIIEPVLNSLFGIETEFRTQDFKQMTTALEVLKTFEVTSDENISRESKRDIIMRVFDLDPTTEQKYLSKQQEETRQTEVDEDNQNTPEVA